MEFKQEELVEREIEISGYLINGFSLKNISEKTGINKKHVVAHIRNMMTKSKVDNIESLIQFLKSVENK